MSSISRKSRLADSDDDSVYNPDDGPKDIKVDEYIIHDSPKALSGDFQIIDDIDFKLELQANPASIERIEAETFIENDKLVLDGLKNKLGEIESNIRKLEDKERTIQNQITEKRLDLQKLDDIISSRRDGHNRVLDDEILNFDPTEFRLLNKFRKDSMKFKYNKANIAANKTLEDHTKNMLDLLKINTELNEQLEILQSDLEKIRLKIREYKRLKKFEKSKYDKYILEKDIHLKILSNSRVNSGVNSRVNSGVNSGVNSRVNSGVHSGVNSRVNSGVHSGVHSEVNSRVNSGVNSRLNSGVNSGVNSSAAGIFKNKKTHKKIKGKKKKRKTHRKIRKSKKYIKNNKKP